LEDGEIALAKFMKGRITLKENDLSFATVGDWVTHIQVRMKVKRRQQAR